MSQAYWQAKIWGLLHDPAFKALHNNQSGRGDNSFWENLKVMQEWQEKGWNPETSGKTILKHIHLADYIASASDRGAIGSVSSSVNYKDQGITITHLLSGENLTLKLQPSQHQALINNRRDYLQNLENKLHQAVPEAQDNSESPNIHETKRIFWWLWRCLPEAACRELADPSLLLMPAETRLPDSSIWSHASLTAAFAGALAGYSLSTEEIEQKWSGELSLPYLASFTFSPVQELIKASRKMRDFWAGSWLLHYLSAKVSWRLAQQYGPDCLLYPNLYQQPLIDHWLLQTYPEFREWIAQPRDRALLTAGFPNVLVVILPQAKVAAAMQTAKSTLLEAWREVGQEVLDHLQTERQWMPELAEEDSTWRGWLESQWQTYWTAIPIGTDTDSLKSPGLPLEEESRLDNWINRQNEAYNAELFRLQEQKFLNKAAQYRFQIQSRRFSVNVGSWWADIFDSTRLALTSVKNARNWVIPTAFGTRSTVSGLGSVVHPPSEQPGDWITEGESQKAWQQQAGLFDGREQLNATETLKRGLEKVLPKLLNLDDTEDLDQIAASYPDLTAGVAGYLKVNQDHPEVSAHFQAACKTITEQHKWAKQVLHQMKSKWGIPWIDEQRITRPIHSRLLNAGWLVEDAETNELKTLQTQLRESNSADTTNQVNRQIRELKQQYRQEIQGTIDSYYPSNNPANWYVLAAGDGDGMSEWLKGVKLENYQDYIPPGLGDSISDEELRTSFQEFLATKKRMGPSTHNALSRALLDFSNQLVPYLTEERYAGRLIYGGGDDVLAYTNLWEWEQWLWDIRQCFRGAKDPHGEFQSRGDYWRWQVEHKPESIAERPLFTMGSRATISFGLTLAHHSVPLAIALENLWEAEAEAKDHVYSNNGKLYPKDAVQVRVLYSNGNVLKATCKFDTFQTWQGILATVSPGESAVFEQAATLIGQHPIPDPSAIAPWTKAFVARREGFQGKEAEKFQASLADFLEKLWQTTPEDNFTLEVANWLKLAAFVKRNREIKLGGQH